MMPAFGILSVPIYCIGNTNVPSCMVMPRPGPCSVRYHSGCLICDVIFTGSDQVLPSSLLLQIISCAVSSGVMPCFTPDQALRPPIPCVQTAITKISPVSSSTSTAGSPMPFCACGRPPHSPKSMTTRIFSQVRPESMLRLTPMSMLHCKSWLESYLTS